MMTLQPHSLRLEVAVVQQQFNLFCASSCGFTLASDFVLRHVVNRNGVNKLSQLSIFISFTIQATCLGFVLVYVTQGFCTVNQTCLSYSLVSIVSRNRYGATKRQ
jgi:hypothetical protein